MEDKDGEKRLVGRKKEAEGEVDVRSEVEGEADVCEKSSLRFFIPGGGEVCAREGVLGSGVGEGRVQRGVECVCNGVSVSLRCGVSVETEDREGLLCGVA